MEKLAKRFGDFIKEIRKDRGITLKDMSEYLEISLSLLSDIENNRRKPFEKNELEMFAEKTGLSVEKKNELFDLAARDKGEIPQDIEDIMMYSEVGDIARLALRKTNNGEITVEEWKKLIQNKCK